MVVKLLENFVLCIGRGFHILVFHIYIVKAIHSLISGTIFFSSVLSSYAFVRRKISPVRSGKLPISGNAWTINNYFAMVTTYIDGTISQKKLCLLTLSVWFWNHIVSGVQITLLFHIKYIMLQSMNHPCCRAS